jgi:hypothetical protein
MRPNPTAQGEACGASVGPALFQCNCAAGFANGMCDLQNDRWHSGRTYTHDAVPAVDTVAVDGVSGRTTHRLALQLKETAVNVYSVCGHGAIPLSVPPAFRVAAPFGVNIGGVGPALVAASPALTASSDPWLGVGVNGGDSGGLLGSIGVDFEAWTPDVGLTTFRIQVVRQAISISISISVFIPRPGGPPSFLPKHAMIVLSLCST